MELTAKMDRMLGDKRTAQLALLGLAVVASVGVAMAGSGGQNEFGQLGQQLIGWAQGWLGIIIAIVALLVGLGFGAAKQTLLPVVVAIGIAIALYYGVNVITGIIAPTAGFGLIHPLVMSPAHGALGVVGVR